MQLVCVFLSFSSCRNKWGECLYKAYTYLTPSFSSPTLFLLQSHSLHFPQVRHDQIILLLMIFYVWILSLHSLAEMSLALTEQFVFCHLKRNVLTVFGLILSPRWTYALDYFKALNRARFNILFKFIHTCQKVVVIHIVVRKGKLHVLKSYAFNSSA